MCALCGNWTRGQVTLFSCFCWQHFQYWVLIVWLCNVVYIGVFFCNYISQLVINTSCILGDAWLLDILASKRCSRWEDSFLLQTRPHAVLEVKTGLFLAERSFPLALSLRYLCPRFLILQQYSYNFAYLQQKFNKLDIWRSVFILTVLFLFRGSQIQCIAVFGSLIYVYMELDIASKVSLLLLLYIVVKTRGKAIFTLFALHLWSTRHSKHVDL